MLPLQFAARWRLASVFVIAIVLLFSLLPPDGWWDSSGSEWSWPEHSDKWMHGLVFLVLAVWFSGMVGKQAYWKIALGLLALGLFVEACQSLVSYRAAEWMDVAADTIGIMAGLVIGMLGTGGWCLNVEDRLARH